MAFSNGTAIHDDKLYIVESQRPGVVAVPLDGGELEVVVTLDRCVPDGLAFDAEGGLWISCWQPNRIYHVPTGGEPKAVVDDWTGEYVLSPTNVAFAGTDLDELVLASLAGWGLRAIAPGVTGHPIVRPVVEG
jgi:sugar lactone lactonase YvrE